MISRAVLARNSAWDRLETDSHRDGAPRDTRATDFDNIFLKDDRLEESFEIPVIRGKPEKQEKNDGWDYESDTYVEPPSNVATEPSNTDEPAFTKYYGRERRDYKRRGAQGVYLQHEHLDVKTLGEAARLIVMREAFSRKHARTIPVAEYIALEMPDLALVMEEEEKDLTLDKALDNLDQLRPSDPILSQVDFEDLFELLSNGFTTFQLKAYFIREYPKAKKAVEEKEAEYKWIREQLPWSPAGKIEIVGSSKQKLCLSIMKEVWRLEIREMVDGHGFFFAKISEDLMALMTREDMRLAILKTWDIKADEIDVSKERLSIYASKARTLSVLQKLDAAFQEVVAKQIDVKWTSGIINPKLLDHLGRLTGCVITSKRGEMYRGKKRNILQVMWLPQNENQGAESLDNVIHRLLVTGLRPWDKAGVLKHDISDDAESRLVPHFLGRDKLSWQDKLTQWYRWVRPTSRFQEPEDAPSLRVDDVLPKPLDAAAPEGESTVWSGPFTTTTARFGQVLFKNAANFSIAEATKSNNHIFSPSAPPPANLTALSSRLTSSQPVRTSLLIKFRLPPIDATMLKHQFLPRSIEMHLAIPDDLPEGPLHGPDHLERVVAVLEPGHIDVPNPSLPIDLRLSQPRLRMMANALRFDSAFHGYLKDAKLDLLRGQVYTPPQILVQRVPTAVPGKWSNSPRPYLFAGLEMHRTLEAEYEGHKLLYTTIQAGHHGGRRAELVVEATPPDASLSEAEKRAHAERYLKVVQELASGNVVKWGP
ncbi:hypothetical protein Cob_v006008 [Colletotrichum orbiculare MAFF 240422]|uniref:Uncharacterized protein n=1 Tax=Colletotrichum orbiculare (strain 104-T / ATCC 96160 / CBS 514.97 / LARS 414 / MAFF 240422) TaxID=1213857 RepID=A0A484FT75_COLOR|nr:hypothetical protein Cob_v006008 [Colletotrichum orbiculare MAFF 240422]